MIIPMKQVLTIVIIAVIASGCSIIPFNKSKSALNITADPAATVFINDEHAGSTPFYKDDLKPGDYSIKLTLEDNPDISWQTQITLRPHLESAINRIFGPSEEQSSHYSLSLEKIAAANKAEINIVTLPDNVVVKVDGQPVGFSPVNLTKVEPGDHEIILGSPGYHQLTLPIKLIEGHKLTVSAQLAKDKGLELPEKTATDSAKLPDQAEPETTTDTDSAVDKTPQLPYVEITDTGTGWLRVRSEPNAYKDNELAKVNVGDTFPFIESDGTGWYKIEYEPGEEGWISGSYAQLFE